MRLAYFTNTYPRATDTFVRREVIALRNRGLEVLTYSVRESSAEHDADEEVISEKKHTHYLLPANFLDLVYGFIRSFLSNPIRFTKSCYLAYRTARPGIKGHFLQLGYFLEAILLSQHLVKDKIDHIHNHLGDTSGTVTLLAANLTNIPYSISIHGPHIFLDGLHWALPEKTQYSKFISCIGYYCRSQMMLYCDQSYWVKLKIVRCGIDPRKYQYRPPKEKVKRLIYVGRLSSEKGLPVLIESIAHLHNQGYKLELNILGDGEDRSFLENLARKKRIDHNVNFLGFVDQKTVEKQLNASDIFVLPSFAEGIPVALMEAMAVGVPVIATYVGGIHELVIDKVTGQLVAPSDSRALADAIARYVENKSFCASISLNARKKVIKDFNINNQVDKLEELFATSDIADVV